MTMLQAAIAWQVYDITDSKLQLGVLGLVQFVPSLMTTLVAGAVADSFDRRRLVMAAQCGSLLAVLGLCFASASGDPRLAVLYGLVLCVGVASAFEQPARQALLPAVVTPETFPHAITTATTIQQFGFVSGYGLGGGLIGLASPAFAYGVYVGLAAGSLAALAVLRPRPADLPRKAVSVAAIREGVHFVWTRQVLLGCMTLDMFAVIFGGATALLPVFAEDILHVGAFGYGVLYASLDIGALLMSVALVALPPIERTGRALLLAVLVYGIATIAFGLSRSYPLSLAVYMLIGAADQVSVVARQQTIQLATPDDLRGRVSSVNSLFIGASNRLGAVESGFVAAATSATFAVVSGGIGTLGVVALVAAKMPELRKYRIRGVLAEVAEAPALAAAAEEQAAAGGSGA